MSRKATLAGLLCLLLTATGCGLSLNASRQPGETHISLGVSAPSPACYPEWLYAIGATDVWRLTGTNPYLFEGQMTITCDGAPDCYHPTDDDLARDWLANAGAPGNWWALVVGPDGEPVVQGASDPMPGFLISKTELQDPSQPIASCARYVDASVFPFIVLPYNQLGGASPGDFATVLNRANGRVSQAIFADLGPPRYAGEGSVALAERLGVDSDARWGGATGGIIYIVYPGSGNGLPRGIEEIDAEGARLFQAWGGMAQLSACLDELGRDEP